MKVEWSFWRRRAGKTEATKRGSNVRSFMIQQPLIHRQVIPLEEEMTVASIAVAADDPESEEEEDLSISFGYRFRKQQHQLSTSDEEASTTPHSNQSRVSESSTSEDQPLPQSLPLISKHSSSFSCLSGAALNANATLANTALGNGLIGEEILPGLDSPRTFRKLVSSASATMLELSQSLTTESNNSSMSSPSTSGTIFPGNYTRGLQWFSAPNRMESASFLNARDVQTAGGAAGEDRVQAVCSEENGWLYCGVYDGFNGRDAADYLAGTFYQNVGLHLRLLEWHARREQQVQDHASESSGLLQMTDSHRGANNMDLTMAEEADSPAESRGSEDLEYSSDERFRQGVMQGLERAFFQTESDFMEMVDQEMDERPELVMVGSCVLALLMHGQDLYTLNLGDSRAVLATTHPPENSIRYGRADEESLWAVQMTEAHVVDNVVESERILSEHPDDPSAISGGRLKGKLLVTRAFGAGYLKNAKMNNALMGILRVRNLFSPPYLGIVPCVSAHRVSAEDSFVVLGSDGLFDFFTNEEVVRLVHKYVLEFPTGHPAKYMLEQLLVRAAENAGMTVEQLKAIPIGRRRKYHDDVTVIVISLAEQFPTSTASTVSVSDDV